jgi:hypothetical protein
LCRTLRFCVPVLIVAGCAGAAFSQDRMADLRGRFATEPDPVRQAKMMPQLGDAEFQQVQSQITEGRPEEALAVLGQYWAEAQTCEKGLDARGIDAEKHPSGFKQLQISLQESLRRLDALLPQLISEEQTPFLEIRREISDMDMRLIRRLFPHDPSVGAPKQPPTNHSE